ncbi:MAG: AlbA family DNA-binding domain-containing protein [Candidatus Scalindua sp.]
MKLFNKALDDVTIDDINTLVQDGVTESRTLDYKLKLHLATDGGNKEFLKDVSAFSNTMGGYLVYGIKEDEGVPKSIQGVEVRDFDKFKLHCENLLRSGVDPVIRGVDFRAIDLAGNKKIVIIEIPKSISSPHVVKIKKHFKFYGRNSGGVHQLEVDDLRKTFLASETLATKIRGFRNDRLSKIVTGETPLLMCSGAKIVLHIIPVSSFELGKWYDVGDNNTQDFPPITARGWNHRMNFDGLITYLDTRDKGITYSYAQVFRNGIIEAIDGYMLQDRNDGKKTIPSAAYEIRLIEGLKKYLSSIEKLGIEFPVWICLSLLGVEGYTMALGPSYWLDDNYPIDRNELILPEIQVENNETPVEYILKPAFDLVWNACGFKNSYNYDEDGNWKPK